MNIYDFDKTIYDGDSSIDFYKFCIKSNKCLILHSFKVLLYYLLYFFKQKNKNEVKEAFFSFLKKIDNPEEIVNKFFNEHKYKIKSFYLAKKHSNDIIISASPDFLVAPFASYLETKDVIASDVDIHTGKFRKDNCKGINKVKYLKEKYPTIIVNEVYSDSLSDMPLMEISKRAYIVKGNKIKKYK